MGGLDFDPTGFEESTHGFPSGNESPGTYAPVVYTSQDSFTGGPGSVEFGTPEESICEDPEFWFHWAQENVLYNAK